MLHGFEETTADNTGPRYQVRKGGLIVFVGSYRECYKYSRRQEMEERHAELKRLEETAGYFTEYGPADERYKELFYTEKEATDRAAAIWKGYSKKEQKRQRVTAGHRWTGETIKEYKGD